MAESNQEITVLSIFSNLLLHNVLEKMPLQQKTAIVRARDLSPKGLCLPASFLSPFAGEVTGLGVEPPCVGSFREFGG